MGGELLDMVQGVVLGLREKRRNGMRQVMASVEGSRR
jgi:hypothetical protein